MRMASSSTTRSIRPSTSRSTGKGPDRLAALPPQVAGPPSAMTAAADDTVLEAVLRRDRQGVVASLVSVIAMAWVWILFGAGTGMSAVDMLLEPDAGGMTGMMAPA